MNWKETLAAAWKNRTQIADGFYHTYLSHKPEIDAEAARRKVICESNVCGLYDPIGKPETSMIPGQPACSKCHCNIETKVHCTYCYCALLDDQLKKLVEMQPQTNMNDIPACQEAIERLKEQGYDMGPDPLWTVMITKEQADVISARIQQEQFNNRNQ
jgi:hypothetical protein